MVYEKFFYLKENPFNITPDPRFLYRSKKHQEALDLLFFGISERKGFMMLSGEVCTGKTTICRVLVEKQKKKGGKGFFLHLFVVRFKFKETKKGVLGERETNSPQEGA